ncbi:MAG: hypothetical protein UW39_C0011G0050 [Parcubacteria group bacterium GW2011_GWC2_44_17]|uniref:Septum formation initiator n=1 Tax=Candidatus Jacksonbacteria bacterium RIFCSPLOWO2_02_FULL_44_20 TaxID=1798460 RepID=A0A1G2A9J9_9BACT|nr:MAG: hypothetical protein UW39_C0011G0050 [Parcubacteria group bacterium GW2011_GWC2_44_17]KKT50375.1 MAG: hypothetical protein UW40_C0005G0025 [Parcubacteria group bacterium GW2011_GWF2_44_17]OGY70681.1 MAG: hypothetical protein A3E05_03945 [Candidatus Jacksonbacteria bacterium RIFCSPHIGHO2_12_FULL_44_12]OGY70869.1 MAG: hypothetical protein A3C00_03555 [Candidatus Jacksonbacteria bacterium RIFCSPHIGHO2_02_FULL_44_25]OGY72947.1 MAG: hypothetical protein A3H07_05160 [Candidatus Jacksonbacteri
MAFVKSKVFLILEVSFIIVTAISFLQISKKKNSIETEINDLQKERGRALEESRELDKMEQDALSDSYIELEAKRKLGYRKEGETVVVFYEDDLPQGDGKNGTRDVRADPPGTNFIKWLRYFFP